MDNDSYILGDYLTKAHYDIQDMPACDIFVGREEEQLPTSEGRKFPSFPSHLGTLQMGSVTPMKSPM
jgi:hypothetical protein